MPKYRFRILEGKLAKEVRACIRIFSGQSHCEIVELNVQKDPDHHGSTQGFHFGIDGATLKALSFQ
ncbi:MAG: hypothetical protein KAT62_03015 [Desulfuromonadales bacterium]|nr:hypothetical protein [Desulfuromonadales bacterium]